MGKPDAPKADSDSHKAGTECDPVGHPVALQPFRAGPAPVVDVGMVVVYTTIEKVEDVAKHDWRKSHGTPILRETVDPKCLSDKRWIHSEQEPVSHCRLISRDIGLIIRLY